MFANQLDRGLPDYVVAAEAFDVRRRHTWTPGSRFRMYFGGKKGGPTKRSGARPAACAPHPLSQRSVSPVSCMPCMCLVGPPLHQISSSAVHPAGGVYYKGFVNTVRPAPVPGVSTPEEVAAYDPWESVRVEWDVTARDEEKFQVPLAILSPVCWKTMHLKAIACDI